MHFKHHHIHGLMLGAAIVSSGLLANCTSPYRLSQLRDDRAFIQYWPAKAEENGKLRLAVKDLIDMEGVVTTAGSEHFARTGAPAAADAECIKEARRRGVVFVGKTNLTELAVGASGLNDYFGTPKNHLNGKKRLMPGGSSSGSAVAVADGKADVAFGTDTAGSVRTPAACCGIFGLKTTYGAVPLKGVYPVSPKNLDTVGPLARNVPHLVEGMDMLKPGTKSQYLQAVAEKPRGTNLRVARLRIPGIDPQIDRAIDKALRDAGFKVLELGPEFTKAWEDATKNGAVLAIADAYTSDQHLLREKGVTNTTKMALLLGDLRKDSSSYDKAIQERPYWQGQLRRVFRNVDFIALPTLKNPPLQIPLWGRLASFETRAMGLQNTVAVNYAGNPAIAIPIQMEGKKVTLTSIQLIGRKNSEPHLLNAARVMTQ